MTDRAEEKEVVVRNPADQSQVAALAVAGRDEVIQAIARARTAQRLWSGLSLRKRATVLYRYRDVLIDRGEELAEAVVYESGKALADVYGTELFYLYDAFGYWARRGVRAIKPRKIKPHLLKSKRVFSRYEPRGVVGIISPWNFPLVLTVGEALPALMAGNAVIIKPSELTPVSANLAVRWAREIAGFPADLLQTVVGYGGTAEALVDGADMISFTGSWKTGQKVARRAAERLIPMSLELGGKDPMLVLRDANIERAANACVWGALMNSGQVCTSIERVYVEEPVYDEFVAKVVEKVKRLRMDGGSEDAEIGSMTSAAQLAKVQAQVDDAVARGARVLHGGAQPAGSKGLFFEPTVLVDVNHEMAVMQEETFGPLIPIMKVSSAEEALRMANDSPYGLDAAVFTRNKSVAQEMVERLRSGSVCVNDCLVNYVILEAPMGGVKESGFGRRHGPEGIQKFCEQKTVVIDRFGFNSEFSWFPAGGKKVKRLKRMLRLLYRSGWARFSRPRSRVEG